MRRQLWTLILFACLALLAWPQTVDAQLAKTPETVSLKSALKAMLQAEGASGVKKLTINVDEATATGLRKEHGVDAAGSYTVFVGAKEDGTPIGSVVVTSEQGKEGPLQMVIAFRPDGQIFDLGFTVFGEDKGKPAMSCGYLKQNIGKTAGDPLTLGKDIDGISGATWTSTSVAHAVKKTTVVHEIYVKPKYASDGGE